jgi:2-polyprenyl-3-methyl-5-hydroxy-6-metoxy-1,4-benzoquinol methylase
MMTEKERDDFFTRLPAALRPQTADFRGQKKTVEILDFLDASARHYTGSFGLQWTKYRHVQIDRFNGTKASFEHLKMFTLGNFAMLKGRTILEIGSGAGRFTDYLVDLGTTVITVDPSAIFINVALGAANLIPVRGDLFDLPVKRELIDIVFCRGVTQHTADTRRAVMRLFDYVKPGGLVFFDVYHLKWFTPFCLKYWIRPFTRNMSADKFIPFAQKWVPRLLRFKQKCVTPLLPNNKLGINIANQIVPIADYTRFPALHSWKEQVEWSVLDTVDMYTPRYDRPMTWKAIMRALHEVGAQNIQGNRSSFCFKATARA